MTSNPQKLSGTERRKHQRAEFKEVLEVHPVLASKSGNVYEVDEQGIQGKSLDLSEGGLRVLLPVPLE
ncbi:MAG: PilZ domain-containing protein, partial [bacterium]